MRGQIKLYRPNHGGKILRGACRHVDRAEPLSCYSSPGGGEKQSIVVLHAGCLRTSVEFAPVPVSSETSTTKLLMSPSAFDGWKRRSSLNHQGVVGITNAGMS